MDPFSRQLLQLADVGLVSVKKCNLANFISIIVENCERKYVSALLSCKVTNKQKMNSLIHFIAKEWSPRFTKSNSSWVLFRVTLQNKKIKISNSIPAHTLTSDTKEVSYTRKSPQSIPGDTFVPAAVLAPYLGEIEESVRRLLHRWTRIVLLPNRISLGIGIDITF